jgi:hypothetical protein
MNTLLTKSVSWSNENPGALRLNVVVIRLMEPSIEENPATCRLRIERSTAGPAEKGVSERGGYRVQPVPAPPENRPEVYSVRDTGSNLKDMLLSLGNALSSAPRWIG